MDGSACPNRMAFGVNVVTVSLVSRADAVWDADSMWFSAKCHEVAVDPGGVARYEFCRQMAIMMPPQDRVDEHHTQSMRNRVFRSLEWATGG